MCLVSCPFSAIVDKSQIFQTIMAINSGTPVYAAVAPAIAGQFKGLPSNKIRNAFKALGFTDVVEVAVGADLCTVEEAKDFMEEVPEKQPFMATSCCPAWSVMAKKTFPDIAPYISMALTPMVLTGRLTKQHYPDCRVVFIGPCAAKKLEASRRSIRSDIDFVLTFEEVAGMFAAKEVDFNAVEVDEKPLSFSSADGRGFAVSGGVAKAVVNAIHKLDPEREVKVANAQGLDECVKLCVWQRPASTTAICLRVWLARAVVLQVPEQSTIPTNLQWRFSKARKNRALRALLTLRLLTACQHLKICTMSLTR